MRTIYRSRTGKILGVCKGIAEYVDIDPTVIRLATVALFCANPFTILFYFIAALILETES